MLHSYERSGENFDAEFDFFNGLCLNSKSLIARSLVCLWFCGGKIVSLCSRIVGQIFHLSHIRMNLMHTKKFVALHFCIIVFTCARG